MLGLRPRVQTTDRAATRPRAPKDLGISGASNYHPETRPSLGDRLSDRQIFGLALDEEMQLRLKSSNLLWNHQPALLQDKKLARFG